jgi:hypothetical protein
MALNHASNTDARGSTFYNVCGDLNINVVGPASEQAITRLLGTYTGTSQKINIIRDDIAPPTSEQPLSSSPLFLELGLVEIMGWNMIWALVMQPTTKSHL